MKKNIKVLLSKEADEIYRYLEKQALVSKAERIMLDSINNKFAFIKANPYYGNNLSKGLIPEEYKIKYEIDNLYRVELPLFWRMLYSLTNKDEIEIIAFVIDIIDHKYYDKKFGYKR